MSSYDLLFAARPGAAPPGIDAIRAWLAGRPRWTVDDTSGEYDNPLTGLDLNATLEAESDAPPDRAPVVLWICGLRAHNAIEEAADRSRPAARRRAGRDPGGHDREGRPKKTTTAKAVTKKTTTAKAATNKTATKKATGKR